MGRFLLKRVGRGLLTIFFSVTITFFLLRLMPADPVSMMIDPQMSQETIDAITAQYGLDKPLLVQYGAYLLQLLHGNLGTSFRSRTPVSEMLMHFRSGQVEPLMIEAPGGSIVFVRPGPLQIVHNAEELHVFCVLLAADPPLELVFQLSHLVPHAKAEAEAAL